MGVYNPSSRCNGSHSAMISLGNTGKLSSDHTHQVHKPSSLYDSSTLSVRFTVAWNLGFSNKVCSVTNGSVINLEHILAQEGCDVDPQNRIERATPLHAALTIADNELRLHIVESLLDAGADTTLYRSVTTFGQ